MIFIRSIRILIRGIRIIFMQQFTVPQFIDVEDKIIGPITTRQFLIILGGFILIGIAYKLFDFSLFLTFTIVDLLFCAIIAFVKINGRPFHFFILNFIQTMKRPRLRVWNNIIGKSEAEYNEVDKTLAEEKPTVLARRFTSSRLAELSLVVDTRGAYQGEEEESTDIKLDEGMMI